MPFEARAELFSRVVCHDFPPPPLTPLVPPAALLPKGCSKGENLCIPSETERALGGRAANVTLLYFVICYSRPTTAIAKGSGERRSASF